MFFKPKIVIHKKRQKSITLTPILCEPGTIFDILKQKDIEIDFSARSALDSISCNQIPCEKNVSVSFISPLGLGFEDGAILSDIYRHGKKNGLQIINHQFFLSLCLCHTMWHEKEQVTFAMMPIFGKDGTPLVFSMKTFSQKKIIIGEMGYNYILWKKDILFVFL